jgi:transposase
MADSIAPPRYFAIVLRKHGALVGAVDSEQRVRFEPCQVGHAELGGWLRERLGPSDAVVIASRANAWQLYDTLAPLAAAVTIAHPQLAKLLPQIFTTDDPRDTIALARMHAAHLVPALWVPPPAVRDLRALTSYRRRLILQHAEASGMLRNILAQHHLTPPSSRPLGADRPDWWAAQDLTPRERIYARDSLAALNRATSLLAELDERMLSIGAEHPWAASVERLLELPGMRPINAIVLLGAIGEIGRFPTPSQLVGYSGLAGDPRHGEQAGPDQSEAKEGRREIRAAMIDVAELAVRADPHWGEVFADLERRVGSQRAIVAIARKLLVALWRKLSAAAPSLAEASVGEARQRAA